MVREVIGGKKKMPGYIGPIVQASWSYSMCALSHRLRKQISAHMLVICYLVHFHDWNIFVFYSIPQQRRQDYALEYGSSLNLVSHFCLKRKKDWISFLWLFHTIASVAATLILQLALSLSHYFSGDTARKATMFWILSYIAQEVCVPVWSVFVT